MNMGKIFPSDKMLSFNKLQYVIFLSYFIEEINSGTILSKFILKDIMNESFDGLNWHVY